MTDAWLIRFSVLISMLTGVWWMLTDLARRISPDADDWDCNSRADYLTNAIGAVTFLATSVAILGVYVVQRERFGWSGKLGSLAAVTGTFVAGINNPIEHCGGVEAMGFFVWVPAVLLWLLGSLIMGAATLRARLLPYWSGIALIAGTLVGVLAFNSVGLIAYGLGWLVVGNGVRLAQSDRLVASAR